MLNIFKITLILLIFPLAAYAQETQPASMPVAVDLDQCVAYFTQGDVWAWIGGGLMVVTAILGTFTKQSWLGIVREIGNAIRSRSQKR